MNSIWTLNRGNRISIDMASMRAKLLKYSNMLGCDGTMERANGSKLVRLDQGDFYTSWI